MNLAFKFGILFLINLLGCSLLLHLLSGVRLAAVKNFIFDSKAYKRIIVKTEHRIMGSNVQYYVRSYSVSMHYMLASGVSLLTFLALMKYPEMYKLVMAGISFSIPWLMLQFIKVKTTALTEQQAITLITSFKTNYGLRQNIFDTFKMLEETLSYPLKKPIEVMNSKYFNLKVSGEDCLKDFKYSFADDRIKLFADQLSIAHLTGGDVIAICNNFLADFNRKNRVETNDKMDEFIDRYLIYVLIFSTLGLIHHGFGQANFVDFVSENMVGKITLFSTYVLVVWMILKLIKSS